MAFLQVALLFLTALGLAFFCASPWIWTAVFAIVLIAVTLFNQLNVIFLVCCWLLFIGAAAFVWLKQLRLHYFTQPIVDKLSPRMPAISETEREAIESGDVWWEQDLFCGRPSWKKLLSIPKPTLSAEEQAFLDNQVETLCSMLNDWEINHELHDLPTAVWDYLKQERFLGMVIPKQYGGKGFSALMHSTVVMKIATRSVTAAVDTMVPNSLGPGELILHYGTDAQKNHYLPRLARGEEVPCFALTSSDAGSDAGAMTDTGIVCRGMFEGQEVLGIRLTWEKRYITLAPIATVLGLAFRLFDPEHLLGDKENIGITLCLLPTSHPGVETGDRHWPMQLAFMNGPTRGKDVFIPLDWIIGGREKAGQGWHMLMECLSIGRGISLPALGTACSKLSYRTTGAYAAIRKQFNTSIAHFEGVSEALGYIAGYTYLLEACRRMTAGAVDLQVRPAITSAIAKYHMTEISRKILTHAMDIHGGHAVQTGPLNVIAAAYTAIPVSITVEGANILTRNLIIFGQGAIRCHPYVLKEVNLFSSTDEKKYEKLDTLLLSHIGYFISNIARNICFGFTGGRLIFAPRQKSLSRYYRQLTRMSAALALLADASMMLLGGALKRKELISARLGDILSELYLASTVLKYFNDEGKPDSDIDSVRWCLETCLYHIQLACNELCDNFPMRWVGCLLHNLVFPFGDAYKKPSDTLHQKITEPMLTHSTFRDRLTEYCYLSKNPDDPLQRLDTALDLQAKIEPLLKKFQNGLRSGKVPQVGNFNERVSKAGELSELTPDEVQQLHHYEAIKQKIIAVNEFSFDLTTVKA